jgi:hypothetical protein
VAGIFGSNSLINASDSAGVLYIFQLATISGRRFEDGVMFLS